MNKKQIIRFKRKLFKFKTWQVLLILVPLMVIAATFYRLDHIGMVDRVNALIEADQENDEALIKERLEDLRAFVFSHATINMEERNGRSVIFFGTGQFYLENQYIQAAERELRIAEESMGGGDGNPNGNVFRIASDICTDRARREGWVGNSARFIECAMRELEKFPPSSEIDDFKTAMIPSTDLFRHNYASPIWTFGFSGIATLLVLLLILFILVRYIILIVLKIMMKRLKRKQLKS